ncbi:sushi domain-containing protein 6-like isoform X2 [Paroedura picta]
MRSLLAPVMLVGLCAARLLSAEKGCSEPELPPHSAYLCQPPLCQPPQENGTFEADTVLEYLCQPGYILANLPCLAVCQGGEWHVAQGVLCKPRATSEATQTVSSVHLIAGALVLLSAVILALTLCFLVLRTAPSCGCSRQTYETLEDPDFVVEGVDGAGANHGEDAPAPLPSYEEAVYGHHRAPVPPAGWGLRTLVVLVQ